MKTLKFILLAGLVAGLLLLPGVAAADKVQQSKDDKGTIHIGPVPPAAPEKTAGEKGEVKPGEATEPAGQSNMEGLPPRSASPRARRDYFGQAPSSRRQAVKEELQLFRPNPSVTATPVPMAPPEQMPPAPGDVPAPK